MLRSVNNMELPKNYNPEAPYFSIRSWYALREKQDNNIVRGNIENTPEKVNLALELYPIEDYYFEWHYGKYRIYD
jgi:hypothetical protein